MMQARYRRIVLFFARMLISITFWDILLPRIGLGSVSVRTRRERLKKAAKGYRNLAVKLGGVLIKVGQFLSSRVDVLPPEFTAELEGLQDEVPAENFSDIRLVAENEYGVPLSEKFLAFDENPLAAASLGQVHLAKIKTTDLPESSKTDDEPQYNVVVKIQRPLIEQIINTDLSALRTVGKWLQRYKPISRRANVPQLLAEFTTILNEEIDYLGEGRNAEVFAENFQHYSGVRTPKIIWSHTTRRVLTLENVLAIKITDYQGITQAGISRAEVASRLLDTYLKQIFEDGFFHADPHPGNLFVQPIPGPEAASTKAMDWNLTFVDFGMVGKVPPQLRHSLRELVIAVGTQDAKRVIKAYQMMNVLLPDADIDAIERASSKAFDRFWGKNMSELTSVNLDEIEEFTGEFRDLIYELPFQVPQNIIFLARAVGILSGMCTGLDPQFNLWNHLAPFARKLITDDAQSAGGTWFSEFEKIARTLISMPMRMDRALAKIEHGELVVNNREVTNQLGRIEKAIQQLTRVLLLCLFFMGGLQLYLSDQKPISIVFFSGAGLVLIWLLLGTRR